MADRYLDLLTSDELVTLASAAGLPRNGDPVELFRSHPMLISEALGKQVTLDRLSAMESDTTLATSTRLRIAIVTNRLASEITSSGFRAQRLGDRILLDPSSHDNLTQIVATNRFRADAVALLFSYLRPGRNDDDIALIDQPDRLRRALDAHRIDPLLQTLDWLPVSQHAGVLRRLGDLAAFTVGMFPDHGDALTVGADMMVALARTVPTRLRDHLTGVSPGDAFGSNSVTSMLERMGPIWYRRAAQLVSWPAIADPIESLADDFDVMTTFLGELNSRHLLEVRDDLFDFNLIHSR